ncbi:MAG: hypothetical protein L3J95_02805 [Thermoplasmata archaeon]|nr:hypothetical protein [Thermoplasmata archaeon]MCI4359337.1 hypothetical protein [Thermoplasmata archaeon]
MLRPDHPEVLAPDWIPPVLVGRSEALEALRRQLPVPRSQRTRPEVAILKGPPGSGTSVVARRAGLGVVERLRQSGEPTPALFAPVRVRWAAGPLGIATELMHRLDPSFCAHGFSVPQLMAGFLRRLLHSARPAVVLLDDLGADCADIGPILGPLLAPNRFLPEGADSPPNLWLLLAGTEGAEACWTRARAAGITVDAAVVLPGYRQREVEAIVRDRARRALGREAPEGWAKEIAEHATFHGIGARQAIELLRGEIFGPAGIFPGSPYAAPSAAVRLAVEPRLLEAIERAACSGATLLRDVKQWEARLARSEGVRPLPSTTLWRRIVRLEAAGVLRREVRTGGSGGTQSRLELVHPIPGGPFATARSGTPRAGGSSFGLERP